jgi:GNAT superfamily N-acetyltransferase
MNKSRSLQNHQKVNPIDAYWVPVPPGIKGFSIKVFRKLRQHYRHRFQNLSYIFMHCGPFEPVVNPPCAFARYDHFEEIPYSVKEVMLYHEGEKGLKHAEFEMKYGASMWVGLVDGHISHRKFVRRGCDFKQWFVNLNPHDIVLFREQTYPGYRGRGIGPAVSRYLMNTLLSEGCKAYSDCNIHNASSIRALEKNGFVRVAAMKPITRKQALGLDNDTFIDN